MDLCIVDSEDKIINFGQHDVLFLSAHDLIYVTYSVSVQRLQPRLLTCRDFSQFNRDNFLIDIQNLDWRDVVISDDINYKVHILNQMLLDCLNKHAPLKRVLFRHAPAPWLTDELKQVCARGIERGECGVEGVMMTTIGTLRGSEISCKCRFALLSVLIIIPFLADSAILQLFGQN